MTEYLSPESAAARLSALRRRLADEVLYSEDGGGAYWPPTSDYHRLPPSERCAVADVVRRRSLARDVVDLGPGGVTFLPDSLAWDLPLEEQRAVVAEWASTTADS